MRIYFIFLSGGLFLLLISCSLGQKEGKSEAVSKFELLTVTQDTFWKVIKSDWQNKYYNPCIETAKLRISCDDCTGVYLDVLFFVNEKGRLERYEVEQARFCEREDLETCLMKYFYELEFPEHYHQTSFQIRLGMLLKC